MPKPKPPPTVGAGGAPIRTAEEQIDDKDKEVDRWMTRFVRDMGLEEAFNTKPTPELEQVMLRGDIATGTVEVKTLTTKALTEFRAANRQSELLSTDLNKIGELAVERAAYGGGNGSIKEKMDAQLEAGFVQIRESLAGVIDADYQAAYNEGTRESKCEVIAEAQLKLDSKFGIKVEVDLPKVMLPSVDDPFDAEVRSARQQRALRQMERAASKLAGDLVFDDSLASKLRRAAKPTTGHTCKTPKIPIKLLEGPVEEEETSPGPSWSSPLPRPPTLSPVPQPAATISTEAGSTQEGITGTGKDNNPQGFSAVDAARLHAGNAHLPRQTPPSGARRLPPGSLQRNELDIGHASVRGSDAEEALASGMVWPPRPP